MRGCKDYFTEETLFPDPGTCFTSTVFEDWFNDYNYHSAGSYTPLPLDEDNPLDELFGAEVEGSLCTCSSDYCSLATGGTDKRDASYLVLVIGAIVASVLSYISPMV